MKQIAEMTKVYDISTHAKLIHEPLPRGWKVYKISGPLFFAAADAVFGELSVLSEECEQGIILYLDGVSILDSGGVTALCKFLDKCQSTSTKVILADFQFQPLKTLAKAGFEPDGLNCFTYATLNEAIERVSSD